eukprot:3927440-Prymnesium_polylepis.1
MAVRLAEFALFVALCQCHEQGDINSELVDAHPPALVVNLAKASDDELRYFNVVEPASGEFVSNSSRILLAARGGHGAGNPQDETWNLQLVEQDATSTMVVGERGFAAN